MLNVYDYVMIAFYLLFMLLIGWVCRKINKNCSDYFRGGGNMLWWMAGVAGFVAGLTAYTFTAASAKVYETGFFLLVVYETGLVAAYIIYRFFAAHYRQMRVITAIDAVRRRYGGIAEQFWVWTSLPLGLFGGGMGLYIVALFIGTALGINIDLSILLLAFTVTVMTGTGGSWAIIASGFLQMLVIVTVTLTILIRSLLLPELGGIAGLIDKMPNHYVNFSQFERPQIWIMMLAVFTIVAIIRAPNLTNSTFLSAKDGHHAKKAALLNLIAAAFLPLVAFIPVIIAGELRLDLAAQFPNLPNPAESAYLAIAQKVLPSGMMGMLVCAIFAATMSTMDAALNKNAGFFVKNFYARYLRPQATERELLRAGIVFTLLFGILVASIALLIARFRDVDLFSWMLRLNVLLDYPMVVPLAMGILCRKSPGWSSWSTVLVGAVTAYFSQMWIPPEVMAGWFGIDLPINALEISDLRFMSSGIITLGVSFLWYLFTMCFYRQTTTDKYRKDVHEFFHDYHTPIDHVQEQSVNQDGIQYRIMGWLCVAYGTAMSLGVLIPNQWNDRLVFVWCGLVFAGIGGIFLRLYYKKQQVAACQIAE